MKTQSRNEQNDQAEDDDMPRSSNPRHEHALSPNYRNLVVEVQKPRAPHLAALERYITSKMRGAPLTDHTANKPWRDAALGYENVELTADDGTRHIYPVEELVYSTFIGPLVEGMRVCHFDGNPRNNEAWNLVLLTPEEAKRFEELPPEERRKL